MKTAVVGIVSVAVVLLVAAPAGATVVYHDSTGEDPNAADVTSVTVSNNPATGSVSFRIRFGNMPTLGQTDRVELALDTDGRASTGKDGIDCVLRVDWLGLTVREWHDGRWRAGDPIDIGGSTDRGGVLTFVVGLYWCGLRPHFAFRVTTYRQNGADLATDAAPDQGLYRYSISRTVVTVARAAVAVGEPPRAGAPFIVTGLGIYFSDGTSRFATALACTATLAGRRLSGQGVGGCLFILPANGKGKRLLVAVRGTASDGRTYRKAVSYTVR